MWPVTVTSVSESHAVNKHRPPWQIVKNGCLGCGAFLGSHREACCWKAIIQEAPTLPLACLRLCNVCEEHTGIQRCLFYWLFFMSWLTYLFPFLHSLPFFPSAADVHSLSFYYSSLHPFFPPFPAVDGTPLSLCLSVHLVPGCLPVRAALMG